MQSPIPGVLCLEWLDPPYLAGHWTPQMVARAGGRDVLGIPGEPSFRVPWRRIVEAPIDVILVMPCGYGVDRAADEFQKLALPAGWERIPAVREGRLCGGRERVFFASGAAAGGWIGDARAASGARLGGHCGECATGIRAARGALI